MHDFVRVSVSELHTRLNTVTGNLAVICLPKENLRITVQSLVVNAELSLPTDGDTPLDVSVSEHTYVLLNNVLYAISETLYSVPNSGFPQ